MLLARGMVMPQTAEAGIHIRMIASSDKSWVKKTISARWGSDMVVSRNRIHLPCNLPGFICEMENLSAGLITYEIVERSCEIVTLDSFNENRGVATALIESVINRAKSRGCLRLWLITTNDNTRAIRFYQKRGFVLAGLHKNSIYRARQLKPEIPLRGIDGILVRDELELEISLKSDRTDI